MTTESQSRTQVQTNFYQAALEVISDGLFLWDAQTAKPLNSAAEQLLSTTTSTELNLAFNSIEQTLKMDQTVSECLLILDDIHTDYAVRFQRVDGENAITLAVARNISREKAMQKRHYECSADIAHDIRSPLSTILIVLERCYEQSTQNAPQFAESLGKAVRDCRRVLDLVKEVLDYTTIEEFSRTLEPISLDIVEVTRKVLSDFDVAVFERQVELKVSDSNIRVFGDAKRITQAVRNLIGNALSHTPVNSKVEINITTEGYGTLFEICDDGPGVPEEIIDSVWMRYMSHNASDTHNLSGTGLGLAIVKKIVDLHQGRAGIENLETGGCRVWVRFPDSPPPEIVGK